MDIKHTKLNNNIEIITREVKGSGVINLEIWLEAGYKFEKNNEDEYAHLLEHLMMSGSLNYPDEKTLSQIVEETGSYINASTGPEYITIRSEILHDYKNIFFDILADKIINPIISDEKIKKEIKVLSSEDNHNKENKVKLIFRLMIKNILNQKIPKNRKREANKENLINFHKERLQSGRVIIVATGDIKHSNIENLSKKYFDNIKHFKKQNTEKYNLKKVRFIDKNITKNKSSHILLNYIIPNKKPKDWYTLALIDRFLTYGVYSALLKNLRLENGYVYNTKGQILFLSNIMTYSIYSITKNHQKVEDFISKNIGNIIAGIDNKTLERLKKGLILQNRRLTYSNKNHFISNIIPYTVSGNKIQTIKEIEKTITEITKKDLISFSKKYLNKKNISVYKIS